GHAAVAEIVLPPELEVEKPATLAAIDSDGMLVEGVIILLPGGRKVTTDATGRARFVVTSEPGAFIAEVPASALQPRVRAYSSVRPRPTTNSSALTISEYPHILVHGQSETVMGYGFRGDAESDGATVGGKTALILAASPMGIVFQTAEDADLGSASLVFSVAGIKYQPLAATVVSLEISQPVGKIVVGEKNEMFVRVAGTEQKVILSVENRAPDVVELTDGNFHWVMSSGGTLNEATIGMRARAGGDFSVSVRVAPGDGTTAPDLKLARRELMAAHGLAEDAWPARLDRAIARLDQAEKNPRDAAKLQQEIAKILLENPPPDVKRHLQTAWLVVAQK
ncbi:MAG TPA: hypothetical protein VIH72_16110, partial [Candidatus Acidoferrales bacterium]